MSTTNKVTVNFVSKRSDGGHVLNLVEEGPWNGEEIDENLRRVQDRFYNCIDALLDGVVAQQFPESFGQIGVIRLGCYDLPNERVREFFDRFVRFIESSEEYQNDINSSPHITALEFKIDLKSLDKRTEQGGGGQAAIRSESK